MTADPRPGQRLRSSADRTRWTELPWHAPGLAAALVIGQYNGQITSVMAIWRPLVVLIVATLVLAAVVGLAVRSLQWGGLTASTSLLLLRNVDLGQALAAFFVVIIGLVAMNFALRWRAIPRPAAVTTRLVNIFAAALLAILAVNIVVEGRVPEIVADWRQGISLSEFEASAAPVALADASRPDVYLIQLDGYPRADTLNRLFDFDNSAFVSELEARGLLIASDSHSNYMYTELTMASMLQMRHISDIPDIGAERDLRVQINHNPTFDAFRERGYIVAATASGWESEAMRSADVFCGASTIDDFERNLLSRTVLGRLIGLAAPALVADQERTSVNTALDCISDIAAVRTDRPRFLYAHVPAPHLPILFDSGGNPATPDLYGYTAQELSVTAHEFQQGYTAGLEYLNSRVIHAVDAINAQSTVPPIIIIFSDHGSESHLNWGNALLSDMDERFSNFFAAATPGAPGLFGEHPTPVNTFPVLLNHYLGADYPLRPESRFMSTVQDRLGLAPAPSLSAP